MISKIQQINLLWVVGSLVLLYDGASKGQKEFAGALVWVVLLFCWVFYLGKAAAPKKYEIGITGEEAKGQWENER